MNSDNYLVANSKSEKSNKISGPLIHNISKELQIFLENFEQRFRKEIKTNKLNPNPNFSMTKELEISKKIRRKKNFFFLLNH